MIRSILLSLVRGLDLDPRQHRGQMISWNPLCLVRCLVVIQTTSFLFPRQHRGQMTSWSPRCLYPDLRLRQDQMIRSIPLCLSLMVRIFPLMIKTMSFLAPRQHQVQKIRLIPLCLSRSILQRLFPNLRQHQDQMTSWNPLCLVQRLILALRQHQDQMIRSIPLFLVRFLILVQRLFPNLRLMVVI